MTVKAISSLVLFAFALAPLAAQEPHEKKAHGKETAKNARFERFKLLAGEWEGKEQGKEGFDVRVKYKVTAGGSAVVETLLPGTDHEMVTVIHRDGDDLLLTHYCMLGNQPQMKASGKGDDNKVEFKFVRATNMKSEKEMHMHDVAFTFVNDDTLRVEWTNFKDGKDGGRVLFELKRKKVEKSR